MFIPFLYHRRIGVLFVFSDHHSIDPIANRENENRSHPYGMSPNGAAVGGHGNNVINMDLGRKQLDFSPDHVQCLCEALQQKGDVEKLATLLWSLPSSDFIRSNESILRWASFPTHDTIVGMCVIWYFHHAFPFYPNEIEPELLLLTIVGCITISINCSNRIVSLQNFTQNCNCCGSRHTTKRRKKCVAESWVPSINIASERSIHCQKRYGMAKKRFIASRRRAGTR